jgi:hypothetical protein
VRGGGRTWRIVPGQPASLPVSAVVVLTAYNPASNPTSHAENRAALRTLRATLDAAGHPWLPARAHGTGETARQWDEPGFALSGEDAVELSVALGQMLDQNAVLVARAGEPPSLVVTRAGSAD